MAKKYKILETDPKTNTHEFLVDIAEDLVKLPKETGSLAFMANTGDLYVCNNAKEWKNVSDPDAPEIVNPSGTLTITENGTGIDVTEYAAVDVNVVSDGDGISFGEIYSGPYSADEVPVVGDELSDTRLCIGVIYTAKPSSNQDTSTILAMLGTIGDGSAEPTIYYAAKGLYLMSKTYYPDNINAVDAYVCELEYPQAGGMPTITSVTPWDGQIDVRQTPYTFDFGFIMPDLGEANSQTFRPASVLIFHVYKATDTTGGE